jgi:hypothetical protein
MGSVNTSNSGSLVYNNGFSNSNAYRRVILPLGEAAPAIVATYITDGVCPYVKLDTYNEGNAGSVELRPAVISNKAAVAKAMKGTMNSAKKAVNVFGAWAYNCTRSCTAQALDTSIGDLTAKAAEMTQAAATQPDAIVPELEQIIPALQSAQKTVFYVYRTYNLNPDQGVEQVEDRTKTIGPQYDALSKLIDDLSALHQRLTVKIEIEDSNVEDEQPERMFQNDYKASQWFIRKRDAARSANHSGNDAYADLQRTAGMKGIPQQFIAFVQSIDKSLMNDRIRFDFVKEVLGRSNNAGGFIKIQPDRFEDLFRQLYANKAPREVYQAVFGALTKNDGNVPSDLVYAPAVLNAIMNNATYFPIFDSKA